MFVEIENEDSECIVPASDWGDEWDQYENKI